MPERSRFSAAVLRPLAFLLVAVGPLGAQAGSELPSLHPISPASTSRSGLYLQPYHEVASGWRFAVTAEYASVIELQRGEEAGYLLDAEVMRVQLTGRRDLSPRAWVLLNGGVGAAGDGIADGALDWYHDRLGIRMWMRDARPRNQLGYTIRVQGKDPVTHAAPGIFASDPRATLGLRHNAAQQTALSVTLPLAPEGFGRRVPSLSMLHAARSQPTDGLLLEGSIGAGWTPPQGPLAEVQHSTFWAGSGGFRGDLGKGHALYGMLFVHSPYYRGTTFVELDRREIGIDFGWMRQTRGGRVWRIGLTEDVGVPDPGPDIALRLSVED